MNATMPLAATAADSGKTRPIKEQVVLVLQGGGALGAYQAGVYQALMEGGIEPDWVIGTSIGAINSALIAGNAPRSVSSACKNSGPGSQRDIRSTRSGRPPFSATPWSTCRPCCRGYRGSSLPTPG